MWIPLSKGPHWSRKRPFSDDNNDFMLPPHLMKKPKTEVLDAENMFLNGIELGHSSIQGFRVSMEDAHIIGKLNDSSYIMHFYN